MKRLLWIVAPLCVGLLLASQAFAAPEIGGITEVIGGVDILRGGKLPAESAKMGDKINQGDVIRTKSGGKTQILFNDESVLTIAPDSRVAINEFVYKPEKNERQANIKIFNGLVHTLVNKVFKQERPDFTVETQTAVIGVRGTDYFTLVAPATSDIYNNSGTTQVNNIFAEIPGRVKLQGKEYTQVAANRPPTLPLPLNQDDINWIKGQMTPKVVAKPSGSGPVAGQGQLLGQVASSTITTQNRASAQAVQPAQLNVVQNTQSAVYVPPQPLNPPAPVGLPTPFNIYVTWGSGARDLDLYLSSPTGTYYYANPGTPTSPIFYHTDSIVPNGSEVITISQWNNTGNYNAYVHNYTNRGDANNTVLALTSGVQMQLIRGGTVSVVPTSAGDKAIVTGGTVLQSLSPATIPSTANKVGTYWNAVAINPNTGTITQINTIGNTAPTSPAASIPPTPVTPVVPAPVVAAAPASATAR